MKKYIEENEGNVVQPLSFQKGLPGGLANDNRTSCFLNAVMQVKGTVKLIYVY